MFKEQWAYYKLSSGHRHYGIVASLLVLAMGAFMFKTQWAC